MSADDWGESEGSAKRRGVPPWMLWGCGGGCLLVTLVLVLFAVAAGRFLHEALDPEKAWAGVRGLLAFDERPEGWRAFGRKAFGHAVFVLQPPGDEAVVIVQGLRTKQQIDELLDPEGRGNRGFLGLESASDLEAATLTLQGREVPCLYLSGGLSEGIQDVPHGIGIRIDVSGSGEPTLVHIALREAEGRIAPERVSALLAPFDLWRGR